jgi:hypothetical protein
MRPKFRLQFLVETSDATSVVLEERKVRAADASAAVREVANAEWPTRATSLRLTDFDGGAVYEKFARETRELV